MEVISLKMESELLKDIDNTLKKNKYSTRTEFIRDSIRRRLTDLEKEEAIKKLITMKGSLKSKRITNKTEREIREELSEKWLKEHEHEFKDLQ